jgi:hypothetical protein
MGASVLTTLLAIATPILTPLHPDSLGLSL